MFNAYPELTKALGVMLDKIDASVRNNKRDGAKIKMYLAGGMAVNFYCGSRYTEDVDASFSSKLLLRYEELIVDYQKKDGSSSFIYFDANYSPLLSLLHDHYEHDAVEWPNIGNENRAVELYVLSPVDLALSKLSRFSSQDAEDILDLAVHGLIDEQSLIKRTAEAISGYLGNTEFITDNLNSICVRIRNLDMPPSRQLGSQL